MFNQTERYLIAEALRFMSDNKIRSLGETLREDGLKMADLRKEFETKEDINK